MAGPIARFIDHAVLLILLTLIPFRAVAGETHTFETPRLLRGLASFGPSPATTFAIAAIIVACAGWVFASRIWRNQRMARTGMEAGWLLLLVASIIAFARAGQKHLALIGAADFLTIVLYAITLRQLLTSRWHLRLGLAVVMATAGMLVAKACYQKWVEWPATIKYYEEHRAELLGDASPPSTTPATIAPPATSQAIALSGDASAQRRKGLIHDYEARLRSGAMTGYFAHPNILGSCMAMLTLCCGGIAFTRWRGGKRGAALAPTLLAFACAGVLIGSQSKGAGAACIASAFFFLPGMVGAIRPDLLSPRITKPLPGTFARRMVIAGWILAAIGASSLFAMLRAEPGLLGLSMRYRAMYWEGAMAMVDDVGVWGIGPDNFGRLFTRYKPVACPEEVDDPHNWLIKSFVEYGWLGAAGLLLLLIGGSLKLAAAPSPSQGEGWGEGDPRVPRAQSVVLNLAVVLVLFALTWCILIAGAPMDFTIVTLALGLAPFALFFVAGAIERADSTRFDDADMPLLAAGLGAGLVAFLAHAIIDLALFTPGAATMFFAVAAITLAAQSAAGVTNSKFDAVSKSSSRRLQGLIVALVLTLTTVLMIGWQSFCAYWYSRLLQSAPKSPTPDIGFTMGFHKRIDIYLLDGTAIEEHLDVLTPWIASQADADEVLRITNFLERRDPFNAAVWHHRMAAYSARFAMTGDVTDLRQAVTMQRKSVETYPTSPLRWLALGDLLERLAEQTHDPADRRAAADALQRVLDLDAQRIYVSRPNRLSTELVRAIRERIGKLR